MAFMVPLVKNHYDIYARNNPADHPAGHPDNNNSLYLSATSLGKNGSHPVTKQYRIVISGGKVVGGAKAGAKKATAPAAKPGLAQAPGGGKLYYRMPSASISLPVVAKRANSVPSSKQLLNQKKAISSPNEPSSPQSVSPPSRPLPHVRRTVRNPMTNRVYSYSVSIPDYVAEEDEEELEESDNDNDDDLDDLDLDLGDDDVDADKENQDLLLFSTSAPAGTGPIVTAQTPSPPPAKPAKKTKKLQQQTLSSPSSPEHLQPAGQIIHERPPHNRTLSSTSTTSTTTTSSSATTTNSREYVELLRKFILHLKMLKIGGSGNKKRRSKQSSATNNNPIEDQPPMNAQQLRPRKRKDTMEDSNHL